jgi:hypothetical protein
MLRKRRRVDFDFQVNMGPAGRERGCGNFLRAASSNSGPLRDRCEKVARISGLADGTLELRRVAVTVAVLAARHASAARRPATEQRVRAPLEEPARSETNTAGGAGPGRRWYRERAGAADRLARCGCSGCPRNRTARQHSERPALACRPERACGDRRAPETFVSVREVRIPLRHLALTPARKFERQMNAGTRVAEVWIARSARCDRASWVQRSK